ncbi:MAG: hypothetical protein ACYCZO_10065 [Daejeonella sp.]
MATSGMIGSWAIDASSIQDISGSAYLLSRKTHAAGGVTEVMIGPTITSPSPDTNLGSEAIAAIFKSTRTCSNGFNTAIQAVASGGGLGSFALDLTGGIKINGQLGFTGTGSYTSFTIINGIITNAS